VQTMVMAAPPADPAVAEVTVAPAELVAVESAPAEPAMPAASQDVAAQGQSLVAQSERSDSQIDVVELPAQVVVVPEYAADLAAAQVEPVVVTSSAAAATGTMTTTDVEPAAVVTTATAEPVAMATTAAVAAVVASEPEVVMAEPDRAVVPSETRIEQQTVVDNSTGDLVGSVTRTVEVVKVVQMTPARPPAEEVMAAEEIVVVEEPAMTFTQVAETLEPVVQPVIAPAVTSLPTVTVEETRVVTVPATTLDFDDLLSASGPGAGTAEQPIVIAQAETAPATQAAFTTVGLPTAETLAAIIRFGDGSSTLGATERDIVRQLAAIHAERGGKIRLVGHASRPAGSMETTNQQLVNFNISLDRATAVAEELIRLGVPSNEVVVEAAGDNQASADAAQDRRVDVLFGA